MKTKKIIKLHEARAQRAREAAAQRQGQPAVDAAQRTPVTVLVLNYDGGDLVRRCVASFAAQTRLPERVLFIDNGSREYDESVVREEFGDAYEGVAACLRIETNVGYVRGMNAGLRRVLADENAPEWVMTLSNDTELAPDFFERLDAAFRAMNRAIAPNSLVGMLAPKVRAMHARHMLDATGIALSLDGMSTARGQREVDRSQYDRKTHILIPNGVSAIYRTNMLRDVGLMDESFWAYCEDTDIGLRAWLAGWDCRFLPECLVFHARSSTHGEHSLSKLYYVERNHYWVAAKNLPLPLLALNPVFSAYRYAMQAYAILARRGQGRWYGESYAAADLAKATLRGVLDAWRGLPRALVERERMRWRGLRRRSTLGALQALWQQRMRFRDLLLK